MTKGLIIQARLGSKRLASKICLSLGTTSVIEEILKRTRNIKADRFVLAFSEIEKELEAMTNLMQIAKKHSYEIHFGSDQNLLNRYYEAANKYDIDVVARLTSDCPLFDPNIYNQLFEIQQKQGFDFVCNNANILLPIGFDAEVITKEALAKINSISKLDKVDQEHVTPYIKKADKESFYKAQVIFNKQYSKQLIASNRYTLDYEEDYDFLKQCWNLFKNQPPHSYVDLITEINKAGINNINNSIKDTRSNYDSSNFSLILSSYP